LPDYLPSDSVLIWNNTRVIPARLEFSKSTGATIEVFLLEPSQPNSFEEVFSISHSCSWKTIIGNQKKWKNGPLQKKIATPSGEITLTAEYVEPNKDIVRLSWIPIELPFNQILNFMGKTPIPPYLKRDSVELDKVRYQTVYADKEGSVAAPTAGLHFTSEVIEQLRLKNIQFDTVTLHVGSGTFVPLKAEKIGDHAMHPESVLIELETIKNLQRIENGRLTVVGTTSLRSLESLYWIGLKIAAAPLIRPEDLIVGQWDPYEESIPLTVNDSLNTVLEYCNKWKLDRFSFTTRLMIVPGYRFKICSRLITNFHQPSSTLLLLIAAFVGSKWRDIYNFALDQDFRFLSYGDSSLLELHNDRDD
jgi:S-adenosylmethionine:tRNA ribosyltransferase-isomerase